MDNLDHLIANLLNISSNDIESILSNIDNDKTNIFLTLKKSVHHCPFCNSSKLRSKGFFSKKLFIPNLPFENVIVHQRIRRLYCLDCLHSFSDRHYMAPVNHSVSYATLMTLMKLLLNPKMTFKSAAELTHLSESTVIRLFDKYCHIKRYSFPKAICIDEVYTKNSDFKSKYSCIFYDFYNHTVIDVIPCRRKDYLHSYFQKVPRSELDNVSYVCIDMYETYRIITQLYFKKAIICVDSFHVIKHLNDDLSKLRVRIMKSYDISSTEYYLLKSWRNLLFDRTINLDNKGKYNKKLHRFINYRQLLDLMLDIDPELKLAYELKESYTIFNANSTLEQASEGIEYFIKAFTLANIPEYQEFTNILINWKQEIINSFSLYRGRRINNSVAESMNAIIADLISNTKGIRNSERRKKRIMYAVNKTGFSLKE